MQVFKTVVIKKIKRMKIKLLSTALVIILGTLNIKSQTLVEKIAIKSCECIESKNKITDSTYRECIASSMADCLINDKKEKNKLNDYVVVTDILRKVDSIIPSLCSQLSEKEYEEMKKIYYSNSKNEGAYSFYFTSSDMMENEKYKLAVEGLLIAINLDNKFVKAYDHLGVCYRKLKDYDNSIKYYEKSLRVFPQGDVALMNIGLVYTLKSDFQKSLIYYNKLKYYHPNNPEGYFGASKNYLLLKDEEKGLENILIAYKLYVKEESDYIKDAEQIIGMINKKMKSENKEDIFNKIAKEAGVEVK